MNSFEKNVIKYCRTHPEDELSQYILKEFEETAAHKKADMKRWRLIGMALENLQYRVNGT